MARAQARSGISWVHGSLIAFVFLWLVSTILLVWLYTDQKVIDDKIAKATREVRLLASGEERQNLEYFRLASESGPTAIGLAEAARADTAKMATGSAEDRPTAVVQRATELLDQIAQDGLVPAPADFQGTDLLKACNLLYDLYRDERAKREAAQSSISELSDNTAQLAERNEKQLIGFDEQISNLKAALEELSSTSVNYRKDRDAEVAKLGQRIDELRQESAKQSQAFRTERVQLDQQVSELQTRYAELRGKMGQLQISPEDLITARRGDGVILHSNPSDDITYIDLGKNDHLVLGMRFAVYSQQTGIPADGQGMAQIEIVTIYDRSSACRVTRRIPNAWIMPGDIIANPMYDREQSLRFVVAGEFDSNGDGLPDPGGAGLVETLVQRWGGEVLSEVSSSVDFVVIGARPRLPYSGTELSPEEEARNQVAKKAVDAYEAVTRQAQSLSIPTMTPQILTQFLGYTDAMLPRA